MKLFKSATLLAFALPFFASSMAHAAGPGEFCGGIGNIQCDAGLYCDLDGNYPDAGGVCLPEICGGFAGIPCPEGYECQLESNHPDASGHCVAEDSCEGHCGGRTAAGCWCDSGCAFYNDCCDDKVLQCG